MYIFLKDGFDYGEYSIYKSDHIEFEKANNLEYLFGVKRKIDAINVINELNKRSKENAKANDAKK